MKSAALTTAEVAGVAPPALRVGSAAPMARPLNFFQQGMLLWDEVHPYNAVHAVRLPGPANADRLREAIGEACRTAGIGEIEIDRSARTIRYGAVCEPPLDVLPAATRADEALTGLLERQMNQPFPAGAHHPTRWSVFDDASGRSHYVVLAYHHITSDAAGIEMLLAAVLHLYTGAEGLAANVLPDMSGDTAQRQLSPRLGLGHILRAWAGLAFTHGRLQRVHRMPDDAAADDSTSLLFRAAPGDLFARLSDACHRRGIGMNDAFMAALAHALAKCTPDRRARWWRRRLAVGTVISGRKWLPSDLSRVFGVCLADFVTVINRPDAGPESALDEIVSQTRRQKSDWPVAAAGTALRVLFVRHVWPLFFIRNHRSSYRRSFPVCGGVSTVVIEQERFRSPALSGIRYVRAAPPGPAVPIVLAPTVFGDRLELCLIYRKATLKPAEAVQLLDSALEALEMLSGDRRHQA